jgi:superfamily II DNA or RNA helicase
MKLEARDLWTYVHGDLVAGLLEPATSYLQKSRFFVEQYHKGHWDGRVKFLDRRSKVPKFPSGLLNRVLSHLESRRYPYDFEDNRTSVQAEPTYELYPDIHLDVGKYDYQAEALDVCLSAGRGVVKLPTGAGKSEVGAAIIGSVGGRWCWATHRSSLLYQTQARLAERLQRPIGLLGDQVEAMQEVTVCMVQTLSAIFRCSGREHIRDWLRECNGIIGDEIHHLESDQWYKVFRQCPALWRFGLTATPPSPEQGGMYLEAMTGPILIDIPTKKLIRREVLVPPRIWFIPIEVPNLGRKKRDWREVYRECITHNPDRHRMVGEAVKTFAEEKKPSLVLVRYLSHGKQLLEVLENRSLRAGWITGKISQADRDSQLRQLWSGDLDTIVAQVETMGEGIDIPKLRAMVNATGTRGGGHIKEAELGRVTVQILGRGLRKDAGKSHFDYVDFIDLGHRLTKRASLERVSTLESEGYEDFIQYWENYG